MSISFYFDPIITEDQIKKETTLEIIRVTDENGDKYMLKKDTTYGHIKDDGIGGIYGIKFYQLSKNKPLSILNELEKLGITIKSEYDFQMEAHLQAEKAFEAEIGPENYAIYDEVRTALNNVRNKNFIQSYSLLSTLLETLLIELRKPKPKPHVIDDDDLPFL